MNPLSAANNPCTTLDRPLYSAAILQFEIDLRSRSERVVMIDDSAPTGWVPVYVPAELAPEVLRRVASFVELGGAATAGPSPWADATADDIAVFFRDVSPLE